MSVNIQAPQMGESINEATVAKWVKSEGDFVNEDELIAELETEKINLEVTAPKSGVLKTIKAKEGDTVSPGDILALLEEGEAAASAPKAAEATPTATATPAENLDDQAPAVRRLLAENSLKADDIAGTGKGGRLTKEDVLKHLEAPAAKSAPAPAAATTTTTTATAQPKPATSGNRSEERIKMTALRKTIARRLKEAQNTAAMLTTFNEVDLTEVMNLRKQYKDSFKEKHGANLGFMSFFTKAVIHALKEVPALNSEIDGEEIVQKHYYDIGIAVSAPRGLVVPVVRDADKLSFAGIEQSILDYATRARENKLMPDDLQGGTFTITNGGVFGSMLSTPILNAPQVGILGMHAIQQRPMAVAGEVKIRPMMYLALSYDHRIVDGREAVTFLVKIKEVLEDPARLILEI